MGVHMCNRSVNKAIYPNGDDVRSLGISIYKLAFDQQIANHKGVAVQEIPGNERAMLQRQKEEELRAEPRKPCTRTRTRQLPSTARFPNMVCSVPIRMLPMAPALTELDKATDGCSR